MDLLHLLSDVSYLLVDRAGEAAMVLGQVALEALDLGLQRVHEVVLEGGEGVRVGLLVGVLDLLELQLDQREGLLVSADNPLQLFHSLGCV